MVLTVGNKQNHWVEKTKEGLAGVPLMAAEVLETFSFRRSFLPSPLLHCPSFLLLTHHCTWNHASPCQTWRSESRVPLDHIAPGKPMESIGQGEGTPSPPLISTLPVLWLRNFQESGESPIPWQPRSPPLCFKRGWIPNNRSIQSKICSQDQVL